MTRRSSIEIWIRYCSVVGLLGCLCCCDVWRGLWASMGYYDDGRRHRNVVAHGSRLSGVYVVFVLVVPLVFWHGALDIHASARWFLLALVGYLGIFSRC